MKIYGNRQSHLAAAVVKTVLKVLLSLVVLAVQIVFYRLIFIEAYAFAYVRIAVNILGLIIVLTLYNRDMNVGHKLSWIIIILAIPMAGTLLYLLFGNGRNVPKRRVKKMQKSYNYKPYLEVDENISVPDARSNMLISGLKKLSNMPLYAHTTTRLFTDIKAKHAQLLEDIALAKEYIFIEYFVVSDGVVLDTLMAALAKKGEEGVKIRFIYDDVGSKKHFKRKTKKRLAAIPNLELCVYEPTGIVFNPQINYRDHRKIVVIDGQVGYIGGDNLADEYINERKLYGHWRDNAMRLEGDAVYSLAVMFARMWFMSCGEKLEVDKVHAKADGDGFILPFGDGPTYTDHPAYSLFKSMASAAERYLYISTPYFIIDNSFLDHIALAAKQGVDVKILVPKIPDKKIVFAMTRSHYGQILKAGGKIYEYSPGFNHAKNVIVDDKFAFMGTVNCDYRSMLLHFENGALLVDNSQIPAMKEDFLQAIALSEEITLDKWKRRPLHTKFLELLLSLISPLL